MYKMQGKKFTSKGKWLSLLQVDYLLVEHVKRGEEMSFERLQLCSVKGLLIGNDE